MSGFLLAPACNRPREAPHWLLLSIPPLMNKTVCKGTDGLHRSSQTMLRGTARLYQTHAHRLH
jgi:hypothetical protein